MSSIWTPAEAPNRGIMRWSPAWGDYEKVLASQIREHRRAVRESFHRDGLPLPVGGGTTFSGVETLAEQNSAVTVASTTTPTSLLQGDDRGPFPPSYFSRIGAELMVEATGVISTSGTPTLLIRLCSGIAWSATAVTTTPLCGTNAMTATATATGLANADYFIRLIGTTRSIGGQSSTLLVTGYMLGLVFSTTQPYVVLKNATPPTAVTVDFSVNVYLDLVATWGTSSASNTITQNAYNLRSMN
jgi:hypothetical protein